MSNTNIRIEKIIQKSLARDILYLLSHNDLTIPQIASDLKTEDIQSIVAFLSELHYLGLVIPIETQNTKTTVLEKKEEKDMIKEDFLSKPSINWLSPLGISIRDYHSLWQSLNQNKNVEQEHLVKEMLFKVPESLKQRFKNIKSINEKEYAKVNL